MLEESITGTSKTYSFGVLNMNSELIPHELIRADKITTNRKPLNRSMIQYV
jgi:hypothetical protein